MIKCTFTIDSLFMQTPVTVHVALPYPDFNGQRIKNLWALHCAMKNGEYFFNELGMLNIVDSMSVAVIAPDLGNAFFSDTTFANAGSFLRRELPDVMAKTFNLSMEREDNEIMGISMGAYGALAWILSSPKLFSKAYLLSGVYDFDLSPEFIKAVPRAQRSLFRAVSNMNKIIFDEGTYTEGCDLIKLLEACDDPNTVIRMFCGLQDGMCMEPNESMLKSLQDHGFDASLSVQDGAHEGAYWRRCIEGIFKL